MSEIPGARFFQTPAECLVYHRKNTDPDIPFLLPVRALPTHGLPMCDSLQSPCIRSSFSHGRRCTEKPTPPSYPESAAPSGNLLPHSLHHFFPSGYPKTASDAGSLRCMLPGKAAFSSHPSNCRQKRRYTASCQAYPGGCTMQAPVLAPGPASFLIPGAPDTMLPSVHITG